MMSQILHSTAGLLLACGLTLSAEADSPAAVLKKAQWKARVILVEVERDSPAQKSLKESLKKNKAALEERDLIVIRADAQLRKKFAIPPHRFTAILIGKDGGEKARQSGELALDQFFALIDTMPMRQQEMREQKK